MDKKTRLEEAIEMLAEEMGMTPKEAMDKYLKAVKNSTYPDNLELDKSEGIVSTWECNYCSMRLPMSVTRCNECGSSHELKATQILRDLVTKLGDRSHDDYDDVSWYDELQAAKRFLDDKRRYNSGSD